MSRYLHNSSWFPSSWFPSSTQTAPPSAFWLHVWYCSLPTLCLQSSSSILLCSFMSYTQIHISTHPHIHTYMILFVFNYVYKCVFVCGFVHMSTVPTESRRGWWISWSWSYKQWGTQHECWNQIQVIWKSSHALILWAISLAPINLGFAYNKKPHSVTLSESDLFCSMKWFIVPSTFLRMSWFHFSGLCKIPLCIYSKWSYLLMDL